MMEIPLMASTVAAPLRISLARWTTASALGLFAGFLLLLGAQVVLGMMFGHAIMGGGGDELTDSISEVTGESGVLQDYVLPMMQGLCLILGPALLQAIMVPRLSDLVARPKWVMYAALSGALGGLALSTANDMLRDGMVQFDYPLALEFARIAFILSLVHGLVTAFALRPHRGTILLFFATVFAWGIGVAVGTAVVVSMVRFQVLGENQLEGLFTLVVAFGALVAGAVMGIVTGAAIRRLVPVSSSDRS